MRGWMLSLSLGVGVLQATESCEHLPPMIYANAAQGINQLGIKILSGREATGSCVLSPLLCAQMISALEGGARGQTRQQLTRLLPNVVTPEVMGCVTHQWSQTGSKEEAPRLLLRGAVWLDEQFSLEPGYLQMLQKGLGWHLQRLSLSAPEALDQINDWVASATEQKVPALLRPEELEGPVEMVLTNTALFDGLWRLPFDPEQTKERDFTPDGEEVRPVPMMEQTAFLEVAELPHATVVALPLKGPTNRWTLLCVRPHRGSAHAFLAAHTNSAWRQWLHTVRARYVRLQLPHFKITTRWDLRATLESMGVRLPFQVEADFTGMSAVPGLHVGVAMQEATIEVSETGVRAAGASAAVLRMLALRDPPQPLEIRMDRSFVFALMDRDSSGALFIGVCHNPQVP